MVCYSSHMYGYSRCQGERGVIDRHLAPKKAAVSFEGFFNHENDGNACGRPRVNKVFIIVVVFIC